MRATPFAPILLICLAGMSACGDTSTPLAVTWLEWSDSVTAGVPFRVRTSGLMTDHPTSLRIYVTVARDTITIMPFSAEPPCRGVCAGAPGPYDTLVRIPAIRTTTSRTVVVRAPSDLHRLDPPFPPRTFGTITVSVAAPVAPHMRSVGMASGAGAAGCYYVRPLSSAPLYVSADQSPAWAPGFIGFVYGRTDPVLRSACRDGAYVIQLDSIIQ